jgi:hypothetical protein
LDTSRKSRFEGLVFPVGQFFGFVSAGTKAHMAN